MAKRGRKPKKVEEVSEKKIKDVEVVKVEKTKGKKVKEEKIEVQEELFKDEDLDVIDSDSFEEYDDEELEDDEDEVVSKKFESEEIEDEVIVNNESNELKNIKLISIVCLCVSVVTLILTLVVLNKVSDTGSYKVDNEKDNDSSGSGEVVGYDVSKFESITADDFINMFEEDETYFVYTGRSTCGYCVQFIPVLNQSIEEYDYTLHYLDVSTVADDDYETIIGLDEELESNFGYTPMVFVVRDGKVVDVNEGYSEYEGYQTFLEDNGIEKK